MTNDEAKRVLENTKRERAVFHDPANEAVRNQALDLALWWAEQQKLVEETLRVYRAYENGPDTNLSDLLKILWRLHMFEREHPRPDQRPPMSDDGPGNTL